MKINMPVTNREVELREGSRIVTKTDLKGIIIYANRDFVEISGFSEHELVGSNHTMVRHPDMPPEVFAGLWENLKAGHPWTGMMSVRGKPMRQQIETVEGAYRLFRKGKAKGLRISQGKVVKDNLLWRMK